MRAVPSRLIKANAQILAHPVDGKAEIEFSRRHGLVAVLHLPGLRRALGNGRDQLLDVEAGLLREMQSFGETLHDAGDADLVDHLGELAGARAAEEIAGARVGRDHLFGLGERRLVAAAHHGEHAILGAGLAARHRRVDEIEAAFFGFGVQLARDRGRGGGVIDDDRALAGAGVDAVLAEHDFAQVIVVADAGHDEVLAGRGGLRRRRALAAILGDPFVGLGAGAVVDRDVVAALVFQMSGHRVAHHAQADKRHLRHGFLPNSIAASDPSP